MRGAILVRWTGRGMLRDLRSSVDHIMRSKGKNARASLSGNTVIVRGAEPSSAATLLGRLPGVEWVAIGESSTSLRGLASVIGRLAPRFVRAGDKFAAIGESTVPETKPSDLAGEGTNSVLDAVKGARVSETVPRTKFRIALDRGVGVAGVELCSGPGGASIGQEVVSCLVSGGKHSSVLAWAALLSGYSVRLVHAKLDEGSLRAVAHLYSELSHRVDPRQVELVVLTGPGATKELSRWAREAEGEVFVGLHAACHDAARSIARNASAPLFLLTEEWFDSIFAGLKIHPYDGRTKPRGRPDASAGSLRFGGIRADVHGVLDGLRPYRR